MIVVNGQLREEPAVHLQELTTACTKSLGGESGARHQLVRRGQDRPACHCDVDGGTPSLDDFSVIEAC